MGEEHGKDLAAPIEFLHDHYLKVYLGSGTQRFLRSARPNCLRITFGQST